MVIILTLSRHYISMNLHDVHLPFSSSRYLNNHGLETIWLPILELHSTRGSRSSRKGSPFPAHFCGFDQGWAKDPWSSGEAAFWSNTIHRESSSSSASSYLHHKDDDGFILFESRAICRYIATKYSSQGTPLVPTELKALARFEEAASIETANFDQYASGAAIEKILKPFVF